MVSITQSAVSLQTRENFVISTQNSTLFPASLLSLLRQSVLEARHWERLLRGVQLAGTHCPFAILCCLPWPYVFVETLFLDQCSASGMSTVDRITSALIARPFYKALPVTPMKCCSKKATMPSRVSRAWSPRGTHFG